MKIALVIERMDTARGGRETSTAQIAVELARRGHEVTILCQQGSWLGEGVEVRQLGRRGVLRCRRLANFVAEVGRAVAGSDFDVVHAMLPVPGSNVYQLRSGTVPAQRAASLRRRQWPQRALCRLTQPLNFRRRLMAELERRLVADPDVMCLAGSRMVADELRHHYGRDSNVRVIFNAVDVPDPDDLRRTQWRRELRDRMRLAPDGFVLLTVATNFELKGVREAITAFGRWVGGPGRDVDGRLIVVGRDWFESYQSWARRLGVGRRVHFVPPVDEIFRWYAAADACILLSWYDPCSRVVLEATRWAVPSITTAFNGAAEVLADGGGIVVPSPRDVRAVAAAIGELADPQKRLARSRACGRKASELSIERHVDELLAVYAEAAGKTCSISR